jgi:ribosome biogenesis GTPase
MYSITNPYSPTCHPTILNQLNPTLKLKTGSLSKYYQRGTHNTTFAEMHPLPFGGFLIDTPGIRELGVFDLLPQELGRLFPEFRARMSDCKFHNCQHINEPGCAVLKALEAGDIEPSRYDSYLSIYHGNETRV